MNTQHQLQHLDIKPQNLFLVHNHVKVADVGLVKLLEGMLASVTGGVTPVYAAPETFEGKVSRFSDQYSLSIVYQELLTGQRPYSGTTLRQLVMQHCQGVPDLKALPAYDRPVVLQALAKRHDDRFPSCQAFVDALRLAGQMAASAPPAAADSKSSGSSSIDSQPTEGRPARPPSDPSFKHPRPGSSADIAVGDPFAVSPTPGASWEETPSSDLFAPPTPQSP